MTVFLRTSRAKESPNALFWLSFGPLAAVKTAAKTAPSRDGAAVASGVFRAAGCPAGVFCALCCMCIGVWFSTPHNRCVLCCSLNVHRAWFSTPHSRCVLCSLQHVHWGAVFQTTQQVCSVLLVECALRCGFPHHTTCVFCAVCCMCVGCGFPYHRTGVFCAFCCPFALGVVFHTTQQVCSVLFAECALDVEIPPHNRCVLCCLLHEHWVWLSTLHQKCDLCSLLPICSGCGFPHRTAGVFCAVCCPACCAAASACLAAAEAPSRVA